MAERALLAAAAVAATTLVYALAVALARRSGQVWLNPVLVSILALIVLLRLAGIDYETYQAGGRLVGFWLGPAVVALGVPLYLQRAEIARRGRALLLSIGVGSVVGILSATVTAALMRAPEAVVRSLAPRSVTTPIAIGIAQRVGGIPALSAALVIATGVVGAVLGPPLLRRIGVRSRTAFGLALGASAHGVGTARAVEEGAVEGATSGLAIGLMGIATAVLAPLLLRLLAWVGLLP